MTKQNRRLKMRVIPSVDGNVLCNDTIIGIHMELEQCKLDLQRNCDRKARYSARKELADILKIDNTALANDSCKRLALIGRVHF